MNSSLSQNASSQDASPSVSRPPTGTAWLVADTPIRLRTKFTFALITGLGGMVVGTGAETGSLSLVVVLFAVIGFVCVDWQKLFSLPPIVAYAAMALTAFVCVADFVQEDNLLGRKMVAVAQLLAVAQAILMLQEKSQRLFEQLLVFALLNCIVAAVFNDAFNYAIWFLPLSLASGLALAFLAADQTSEAVKPDSRSVGSKCFAWNNAAAMQSLGSVSLKLPWISLLVLIPAIALFACTFFFALPRRIDPQRGSPNAALVGFSDQVRLGDVSRMQMTDERALRVRLSSADTLRPYPVVDGIYLRGLTLEDYHSGDVMDAGGSWKTITGKPAGPVRALPLPFIPDRPSDSNFFDQVHAEVTVESIRTPALFALVPYHGIPGSESLVHHPMQRILGRRKMSTSDSGIGFPRAKYAFGTHAFRNGIQTDWIAHRYAFEAEIITGGSEDDSSSFQMTQTEMNYNDQLLDFPEQSLPSARRLAEEVIATIPGNQRTSAKIARSLEAHFTTGGRYQYTLDLTTPPIVGIDPIEQFLSIHRRGHCQYFASALAMMLRSQNIPARLVVGYHCDEFNELSQSFIVRQRHAHAWVEALIDRDEMPLGESIYGQPDANQYWLRLDPTPGGGLTSTQRTGASQIVDLAQNFWNEHVVEMSGERQRSALTSTPGFSPMTQSYRSWIETAQALAIQINAGEVRGFGGGRLFSLPAAVITVGFCVFLFILLKVPIAVWFNKRWVDRKDRRAPKPSIAFYAETLELLEQVGLHRATGQTPREMAETISQPKLARPVANLTDWFYRLRYGQSNWELDPDRWASRRSESRRLEPGRWDGINDSEALDEIEVSLQLLREQVQRNP
ncbi:transglutaminase TgpA family protein [Neorhodopirellula pilleata]|uniref:Protein-glutamine gamma-glutamyltransferase n=1 Tax=Neorhodopirellula pilleata TaxID=2714738 RepID=A0A5C6A4A1_9BACT|nr:DUF3488 and transglutaminase-like domain-containing protein [Neorhodopirellula pilleata]TWT94187.1 Protein-glutamine gamma-glutamyltransferase [Neorhodopirellula pilleata]